MENRNERHESQERSKESHGTDKYGSGPGSASPGSVRVHSNTPENRTGTLNPSAPTEATEGPSTNLANRESDTKNLGTTRGEPARGEPKSEGTLKKQSAEKHEAA